MVLFKKSHIIVVLYLTFVMPAAFAGHPFVTDDTNTQGTGNQQLEANTDWASQDGASVHEGNITYTVGASDKLDVYVNVPVTYTTPRGLNDTTLGAKWRFYEEGAMSFALRPELILPTGNQHFGNGNGRTSTTLTLIGSYDAAPWTFNANIGISSDRYDLQIDRDENQRAVWYASTAASYQLNEQWMVAADIGVARNSERAQSVNPAYFLTGLVYSPTKNVDLDAGIKFGLNEAEVAHQLGVGVTWRF
ncbi:transporter [Glaciimonas soli]|uniref:Transporter n=1 Tax=Glaciimonas soli TaxID=2590999 RepID=A0A843YL57_9BURK|nr:transporter [Glaciimonas soli]MQR00145.1 transporter [Glaciimonas soli]